MAKAAEEGFRDDLDGASVARIAGEAAKMCGFPFEEDWSVSFGLKEDDQEKDETRDY